MNVTARVRSWNPEEFAPEILSNAMGRIEKAGIVVRDAARRKINSPPFKFLWKPHGPYKTGKYAGQIWTAREHDALMKTIRVTKKYDTFPAYGFRAAKDMNVWVMSGNYKTWYALQVEYGKAGWKGGPHPFLRPAFRESLGKIQQIVLNGE